MATLASTKEGEREWWLMAIPMYMSYKIIYLEVLL